MTKKKVCVLIPSYNSTVREVQSTITSVSSTFDILVVDDGSSVPFITDHKVFLKGKENIEVLRLEINSGIESALAIGIMHLIDKYEYIARLDIGDTNTEERIDIQTAFLDNNSGHVMVGGWARFISTEGEELFISKVPVEENEIKKRMFINNMFIHPSVMIRTASLSIDTNYRKKYISCEDYDLFFRLMKIGKVANIPQVLINYEVNFNSISSKKRSLQVFNRIRIILDNFRFYSFGLYPYYGLLRNIFMLLISRDLTNKVRSILRK